MAVDFVPRNSNSKVSPRNITLSLFDPLVLNLPAKTYFPLVSSDLSQNSKEKFTFITSPGDVRIESIGVIFTREFEK